MANPNDPHVLYQNLATQAMLASNVMAANQQRASEASEAPSMVSRYEDDYDTNPYGSSSQSIPRRQMPKSFEGSGERRAFQPATGAFSRFSMPPLRSTAPMVSPQISNIDATGAAPPPSAGAGAAPPRQPRPSTQSRRSEQAYAFRRSVLSGNGPRSVAGRGSVAGTVYSGGLWPEDDTLDDLDWDLNKKNESEETPSSSRWKMFWRLLPIIFSLIFVAAGVLYLVYGSDQMVSNFQIWRLCFFLAGLPIIWWIGEGVSLGSVWIVENSKLFRMQNMLYYAYAVRRPLANVVRAALALGWWALAMTAWNKAQDAGVREAFQAVLKVWACVTLFMTANLLKTLLAKMLSSKFNKESHMQKIHDSLVKEYHLHMMLQPRDRNGSGYPGGSENEESQDIDGKAGGKDGGTPVHKVHASSGSGSPSLVFGSIASSMRTMGTKIFGSGSRSPRSNEQGTAAEELLPDSDVQSPMEPFGSTITDVESQTTADTVEQSQNSLRNMYSQYNRQSGIPKTSPAGGGRSGVTPRSSSQNGTATLVQEGNRGVHRTASVVVPRERRGSKLAPVVEEAAEVQTQSKGLNLKQIAKMEAYVRRHALQVTFRDELSATERQEEVTTAAEAKKLAYFLFWNLKSDLERPYICLDDVADFLPPGEAEQAFAMLDRNGNGSVTLSECISAVVEIFEARCDLALSLKDTKTVIGKLENVIGVFLHIIFVFLYMIVFNVDVVKTYLALSSLVLAFSFVFQNSIRTMYENVVFLFVVHPFDVGDVLQIGEGDTAQTYKVDQIDLHYTIFIAGNGARTWYPNQKLMGTPFANVSASGERGDGIKLLIDMDTPAGALDAVRAACEAAAAAYPTEFSDGVSLNIRDASNPLKITLALGFKYSNNGADGGRCAKAKTIMHMALCEALTQFGIRYTNPPVKEEKHAEVLEEQVPPVVIPPPATATATTFVASPVVNEPKSEEAKKTA